MAAADSEAKEVTATKAVRVSADLAEMLSGISWHEGRAFNVAEFLDPLIRDAVIARFGMLPDDVRTAVDRKIAALT